MTKLSSQLPLISHGAPFYKTVVCSNNSVLQAKEESVLEVQVYIGLALLHTNTTTLSLIHCSVCLSRGVGGAISTIILF